MSDPKDNEGKCFAEIHFFDKDLKTGEVQVDEVGEELIGHYYQLIEESTDIPISDLVGPYCSNEEAENAAQKAFSEEDY